MAHSQKNPTSKNANLSLLNDSFDEEIIGLLYGENDGSKQEGAPYEISQNWAQESLESNQKYQFALRELQKSIKQVLLEHKEKQTKAIPTPLFGDNEFIYKPEEPNSKMGKAFFLDLDGMPCPPNEDTIHRIKNHEYDLPLCGFTNKWKELEKQRLKRVVRKVALDRLKEPILNRLRDLEEQLQEIAAANSSDVENRAVPVPPAGGKSVDKIKQQMMEAKEQLALVKGEPLQAILRNPHASINWQFIASEYFENRHDEYECQGMWVNLVSPAVSQLSWSEKETRCLLKTATVYNFQDWDNIAIQLNTNRTAFQCFHQFQQTLSKSRREWSSAEDKMLKCCVQKLKKGRYIPFREIAAYIPGRSVQQCRERWNAMLNPAVFQGKFKQVEDAIIYEAHKANLSYKQIAYMLPGRTQDQIRYRWSRLQLTMHFRPWNKEEDNLLIKMVKDQAKVNRISFSALVPHFDGRNRHMLRSRYVCLLQNNVASSRKRQRNISVPMELLDQSESSSEEETSDIATTTALNTTCTPKPSGSSLSTSDTTSAKPSKSTASSEKPSTSTAATISGKPSTSTAATASEKPSTSTAATASGKPSTSTAATASEKPSTSTVATASEKPSTSTAATASGKPSTSTVATASGKLSTSTVATASGKTSTSTAATASGKSSTSTAATASGKPSISIVATASGKTSTSTAATASGKPSTSTAATALGKSSTNTAGKPSTSTSATPPEQAIVAHYKTGFNKLIARHTALMGRKNRTFLPVEAEICKEFYSYYPQMPGRSRKHFSSQDIRYQSGAILQLMEMLLTSLDWSKGERLVSNKYVATYMVHRCIEVKREEEKGEKRQLLPCRETRLLNLMPPNITTVIGIRTLLLEMPKIKDIVSKKPAWNPTAPSVTFRTSDHQYTKDILLYSSTPSTSPSTSNSPKPSTSHSPMEISSTYSADNSSSSSNSGFISKAECSSTSATQDPSTYIIKLHQWDPIYTGTNDSSKSDEHPSSSDEDVYMNPHVAVSLFKQRFYSMFYWASVMNGVRARVYKDEEEEPVSVEPVKKVEPEKKPKLGKLERKRMLKQRWRNYRKGKEGTQEELDEKQSKSTIKKCYFKEPRSKKHEKPAKFKKNEDPVPPKKIKTEPNLEKTVQQPEQCKTPDKVIMTDPLSSVPPVSDSVRSKTNHPRKRQRVSDQLTSAAPDMPMLGED